MVAILLLNFNFDLERITVGCFKTYIKTFVYQFDEYKLSRPCKINQWPMKGQHWPLKV